MPSVPSHRAPGDELAARTARLERLAERLDARFNLFGIRFGWDSLLGLIPGVGDAVTALPSLYIIAEAARLGTRRQVLARMALNTTADVVIGGVPFLGDLFDVGFKANRRNVALLRREMARRPRPVARTRITGKESMT
jgi:hypothetical protein